MARARGDALALAAGELGGLPVREVVQLHQIDGALDPFLMGGGVDLAHLEREADILPKR